MGADDASCWFEVLVDKCVECGVELRTFLHEKEVELEERKRIMLTPSARWYRLNKHRYEEFAQKVLGRQLTDEERHGRGAKLTDWVERRLYGQSTGFALDARGRRALLADYGNRCAHCGAGLNIGGMHVDHILPRSQGGSDEIVNLQPLCRACNLGKSAFKEDTAVAAGRPWFEPSHRLLRGKATVTDLKRYCVIARDYRQCRRCGRSSREVALFVVARVPQEDGGQLVYDNLLTLCGDCTT